MADISLHPDVKEALIEVEKNESTENILKFINLVNEKKERTCAELVLDYGIKLMADSNAIELLENYKVAEEVFFAALSLQAFDWANI